MNNDNLPSTEMQSGNRDIAGWIGIYVRGLAMGIAEVIPGVSGGTIAFVSGIYSELLASIAALGPEAIVSAFDKGPQYFWRYYNLGFLSLLVLGMACSILLFSRIILFLLEHFALYLWAFFFGLICISVVVISRQAKLTHLLSLGLFGLVIGVSLALGDAGSLEPTRATLFFAGMLAVCAWILPGVSGSYLLLVIGLYADVLLAIEAFDIITIGLFGSGCVVGLMVFSRVLSWLLGHWHSGVMATLSGFTAGSLIKLWPWQLILLSEDERNESVSYLLPWNYTQVSGEAALIPGVLLFFLLGMLLVFYVNRYTQLMPIPDESRSD